MGTHPIFESDFDCLTVPSRKMSKVGCSLGTMEMGRNHCVESVPANMVKLFLGTKDIGATELDTAIMYCGGKTEKILGNIPAWKKSGVVMATKVNPWNGKGLGKESVRNQLTTSLASMKVEKVQIVYLHAPDHDTPLIETLSEMNALHKEGKFDELGLSNFSAWLVAEAVNVCKQNGFLLPTVYQGMYSAATRQVETGLIPCLRFYGMRFYAYSPLGGGILTEKTSICAGRKERNPIWSVQHGEWGMGQNLPGQILEGGALQCHGENRRTSRSASPRRKLHHGGGGLPMAHSSLDASRGRSDRHWLVAHDSARNEPGLHEKRTPRRSACRVF